MLKNKEEKKKKKKSVKDFKKQKKEKSKLTLSEKVKIRFRKMKEALFGEIEEDKNPSTFSLLEVVVIILVSILFGIIIGYIIMYSRDPIYSASTDSNVSEIVNTYQNIANNYYGEIDEDALADAAIKGMIDSLDDPYSNYMDTDTTSSFNETVDGSFVGIGVVVLFEEDYSRIIEVYENSPAEAAGLKVDDVIIAVDGVDVSGYYGDDLTNLIRGKKDTKVNITVRRGEKEKEYTVTRGTIELQSVSRDVIETEGKKIGYLKIDSFASNTYDQFYSALKKLEKKNIDSLILDVRDNPGGHLLQTKQILSLFFNKKTVLYQIETKESTEKVYSENKDTRSYPVVVLINGGSASASEILASCFQENYKKATIVGTTSYGKGTVQKSQSLSNGTSIKYTTQKWLTSKGEWLNEKGVTPDVVVDQADEYYESLSQESDVQLQEALKQLK